VRKLEIAEEPPRTDVSKFTLLDMQAHFVLCTSGVLHATIPGLNRDLVRDFLTAVEDATDAVAVFDSGPALFDGLGQQLVLNKFVDLDRRIYAVRKDLWEGLRNFVGSAAFIASDMTTYQVLLHTVAVVDVVAMQKSPLLPALPIVTVQVFAVNHDTGFYHLLPRLVGSGLLPKYAVAPPYTTEELSKLELACS